MDEVWCVFFTSEETLEWELFSVHATFISALEASTAFADDDVEARIEKWGVRQ